MVFLLGANATQLPMHRREAQGWRSLGKWAWGVSVVALLMPYLAPISLIMAAIDGRRPLLAGESPSVRRPIRMAVLNSAWALLFVLGMFAIMVATGMIRLKR